MVQSAAPKPANRPNLGGTMTRKGVVTMVPPSPAQNTDPNRAGSGGTITRGGVVTKVAPTPAKAPMASPVSPVSPVAPAAAPAAPRGPSPAAIKFLQDGITPPDPTLSPVSPVPVAAPTTRGAQQTESANPLTGDTNRAAGGTVQPVNPAQALGLNRGGTGVPRGQDAMPTPAAPDQSTTQKLGASMQSTFDNLRGKPAGGTGLYRRTFSNPKSAGIYDGYVRRLFGDAMPV